MNEYRFRGTRRSDGAPIQSRMRAQDEDDLTSSLEDLGIDVETVELLNSDNRNQSVSLGCGTLIVIAIIVMIFSNANDDKMKRELQQLNAEVRQLKQSIDAQNQTLKKLIAELDTVDQR